MIAHLDNSAWLLSPGENGLLTLIDSGQCPERPAVEIEDWLHLMMLLSELQKSEYRSIVIDSLDGMESAAKQRVTGSEFSGKWGEKGYAGYGRGDKILSTEYWPVLLSKLDDLRRAGKSVILLAHTSVANQRNPDGTDYHRWIPSLSPPVWDLTFGWCDIVCFLHRQIGAEKDRGDRSAKGTFVGDRRIITELTPVADAKTRIPLPPEIPMGDSAAEAWKNFSSALAAGRKTK